MNPPHLASPFWGTSAQPRQPVRYELVKCKWHIQEYRWLVLVPRVLRWKSSSCPFTRNAVPQCTAWSKAAGSVGPLHPQVPANTDALLASGWWRPLGCGSRPAPRPPPSQVSRGNFYFLLTCDIIGLGKSFLKSQLKTCF